MWKRLIWWWKIIKQYLCNCGIHGVRYLVDDQFSYTERFFWLIFCILCWAGCAVLIQSVIDSYIKYPVAVTSETMYLDWETPYPAVFICIPTTTSMRNNFFKQNPGAFSSSTSRNIGKATVKDLLNAYDEMKVPCSKFLQTCMWNKKEFDCCTEFRELNKTGLGYCIGMNSMHLQENGKSAMKYFVNRTVKYGDLVVDVIVNKKTSGELKASEIYMLNNLQIPTIITSAENRIQKLKANTYTRIEVTMQDTFNEKGVQSVAVERRNCRFPNEVVKGSFHDIYSSESCILEKLIKRMIQFCGCVNFYYTPPPGERVCNGTEMQCLIANKTNIIPKSAIDKDCVPDCEGTSITVHNFEPTLEESPGKELARMHFTLLSHPTVRYCRYVVNDLLDVIVSVGSAVGLFMGASILSVFEIPYWLFVRRDRIS